MTSTYETIYVTFTTGAEAVYIINHEYEGFKTIFEDLPERIPASWQDMNSEQFFENVRTRKDVRSLEQEDGRVITYRFMEQLASRVNADHQAYQDKKNHLAEYMLAFPTLTDNDKNRLVSRFLVFKDEDEGRDFETFLNELPEQHGHVTVNQPIAVMEYLKSHFDGKLAEDVVVTLVR